MLVRWRQFGLVVAVLGMVVPQAASANLLQSAHFRLDPNVASNFGGSSSSTSYKLTDTGGEAVVGTGSSQSYKLSQGYVRELAHSIQLNVLPNGTYAYWPLDSGTGTQGYDASATGDDATLVGAPTWTTGIVGNAITLNGSTQYGSTIKQVSNPTTLTLEIWFKSTTAAGGRLLGFGDAQTGASTNLDRNIYMTNTGQLTFGTHPAAYKTVTTASSYNDGSWHHVAATLGASGLGLYVDGILQASDPTTTTAASYSGYWRLGYDSLTGWPSAPTSSFFAGTIDEARVYSRQLSSTEIKNDYTAGAGAIRGAFTLPNITPGQSQSYNADAVVRTDAGGYDLYIQRDKALTHTDNVTTIPDVTGTVSSPGLWTEGTTKGIGFSAISGTQLEAKWGTNPNYDYAALPSTATVFHSKIGLNGSVPEATTLQFRADTNSSQKQGTYSATITYTATVRP